MNWLSQVIAGKQRPISLGIDSAKEKDEQKDNGAGTDLAARNAAAIGVLRRIFPQQQEPATPEPIPPSAQAESAASEPTGPEAAPTAATTESAAVEGGVVTNDVFSAEPSIAETFSAEDLCGAPVVPLIVAAPSAIDEITAADVCWVPPGRELHPEPAAEPVTEPVAATAEPVDQTPDNATVDEVLTRIEASTTVETPSVPAEEAAVAAEAPPAIETTPAIEAPPTEEAAPVAEAASPAETVPAVEAHPEEPASTAAEAEAQPEAEPQETTASLPENAFANGEIWRTTAELTAGRNGNDHHEAAPATPAIETPATEAEEVTVSAEAAPLPADLPEFGHRETAQPEDLVAAMKALIHLNSAMPWLARANSIEPALMPEVRDEVAGMRLVQYEIKTAVQDHSLQLKRMEENLTRVREAVQVAAGEDIAENVKSTARAVRMAMIGTGATLVLVLIMIGMLLARGH